MKSPIGATEGTTAVSRRWCKLPEGDSPSEVIVVESGSQVKGHWLDRVGQVCPTIHLAHLDPCGCQQCPEEHGHGLATGERGPGFDAAAEFPVALFDGVPLSRGPLYTDAGEHRSPASWRLSATARHLRPQLRRKALRRSCTAEAVGA